MEGRYRHYGVDGKPCSSCTTAIVTYKPNNRDYEHAEYEVQYFDADKDSVGFEHYDLNGMRDATALGILRMEYPAHLGLPVGV